MASIRYLAWEPPYAMGAALKSTHTHTHTHPPTHTDTHTHTRNILKRDIYISNSAENKTKSKKKQHPT